jgi:hypothetical protein
MPPCLGDKAGQGVEIEANQRHRHALPSLLRCSNTPDPAADPGLFINRPAATAKAETADPPVLRSSAA